MANINKNELYNLICEYYENNIKDCGTSDGLYRELTAGMSFAEWKATLNEDFSPASMTALVREGQMEERINYYGTRACRSYYKPLTDAEHKMIQITRAKVFLDQVETKKMLAETRYLHELKSIEEKYNHKLEELDKRRQECIAILEEYHED